MKLRSGKADIPNPDLRSLLKRFPQQIRHRSATQRCFKRKVSTLGNGSFQQTLSLMPGGAVRIRLGKAGIRRLDKAGCLVRIEVLGARTAEGSTTDTAFPCSVCSRQYVEIRCDGTLNHACVRR